MGIETKEFNDMIESTACAFHSNTAKVEYDTTTDKVVSLRYFIEEVDTCEKIVNNIARYAITENKISYEGNEPEKEIEITGNFTKYLSTLDARRLTNVEDVTEYMALILSELEHDLVNEVTTKHFNKLKIETDGIEVDVRDKGLGLKINDVVFLMREEKGDLVNGLYSITRYLEEVIDFLITNTSPDVLK